MGLIEPNVDAGIVKVVGSLVGYNDGMISICYATGSVSGWRGVGGLVGTIWDDTITKCYSSSDVSGYEYVGGLTGTTNVGGLMGINTCGQITASFWNTETSYQTEIAGGTGKMTAEMQMISTFLNAGWDFVDKVENGTENIWWINEGQDYPRLWWEEIEQ